MLKKLTAALLVACMLFCTPAFVSVADSADPETSETEVTDTEAPEDDQNADLASDAVETDTPEEVTEPEEQVPGDSADEPEEQIPGDATDVLPAADETEPILDEDQQEALQELLQEEDMKALADKLGIDLEEEIIVPAKNYTEVGKLLPAVENASVKRSMLSSATKKDDNGLVLSKTAEYDEESNSVKLTLEAYTTGSVVSSSEAVAADIVFVLDESGSMSDKIYQYSKVYELNTSEDYYVKRGTGYAKVSYCTGGSLSWGKHEPGWYTGEHVLIHLGMHYEPMVSENDTDAGHVQFYAAVSGGISKNEALKNAAKDFVNAVYEEAEENDVDHRVSVIGFSDNADPKIGLTDDIRSNKGNVINAIDRLNANGGTYIENGMDHAKTVFDSAAPALTTTRRRVVIVFTDGIPGNGNWERSMGSANSAISSSCDLKNVYGATVYTIGMLDDADPELEISNERTNAARTNKFLHYLSSNYPEARSMDDGGSGENKGYYLSASDTESLNTIFQKISQEISTPAISLESDTVIKDIVSPYFDMPENVSDITVKTYACLRYNESTQEAAWDENGTILENAVTVNDNTLSVTGFDFNSNFVSENPKPETNDHGKKVVIELTITPKEGFLGGSGVPTNGADSGVYKPEGTTVELFDQPAVDIPIKGVTVSAADQNVYLLADVSGADLKNGARITAGNIPIDPAKPNFGLETWQNAFVTIIVTADPEGGYTGLTEDQEYTASCRISPAKTGGEESEQIGSGTGKINVYKPEVTFKDSVVYYGDTAPVTPGYYNENNYVDTVWKHGETTAADVSMTGAEPTLIFDYSVNAAAFADGKIVTRNDIPVKVMTKMGDSDVTEHTGYVHQACDPACSFDEYNEEFLLHVRTCELTIMKQGGEDGENFIFHIEKDGSAYTTVLVPADDSVTIKELPAGSYGISEDESWAWRYEPSYTFGREAKLGSECPKAAITCKNEKVNNKWLTWTGKIKNEYGKGGNN